MNDAVIHHQQCCPRRPNIRHGPRVSLLVLSQTRILVLTRRQNTNEIGSPQIRAGTTWLACHSPGYSPNDDPLLP
jgi:hypothetical protein